MALDMDGTLLSPGSVLSERAAAAVDAARRAGASVVLCTGRMFRSAATWARRLGLTGPVVAYNGALVRTADATWLHRPVPLPLAAAVAGACLRNGWYVQSYVDDELLIPHPDPRADAYCHLAGVTARVDPDRVYRPRRPPTKLLVIEPAERMPQVRAALSGVAPGSLELATSFPHYLEVTRSGTSKGRALRAVARRLGVPRAAVLAVGDGQNDADMVRWAGFGAAVANAHPDVRRAARLVASAAYGDGVAEVLAAAGLWAGGGDAGGRG